MVRAMRGAGVALGVTGLLLVGGCSEPEGTDPSPSASPSASPTASESPSDSPSPSPSPSETSDVPAAAREQTPEGAEAFLEYYLRQASRSWVQAEPDVIRPLGTRNCEFCDNIVETADYLQRHDERYESSPIGDISVEAFNGAPSGEQYLDVAIEQLAVNVIDARGDILRGDDAVDFKGRAAVKWVDDGWLLRGIEDA